MKQFFYSFFLLFLTISSAKAVFIEPMLGYTTGSLDITGTVVFPSPATISDSYDLKGSSYGVRAGFEPGNFQLGAEYMLNNLTTSGGTVVKEDDKLRMKELSAFLAYRFWFMRIYTGLIFSADDNDSDMDGSGFKGGLSFYPFKNLALNLEYKTVDLIGASEGVMMDATYDTLSILVSFPFSSK